MVIEKIQKIKNLGKRWPTGLVFSLFSAVLFIIPIPAYAFFENIIQSAVWGIFTLAGVLLNIAGVLLNLSLVFTVEKMSLFLKNAEGIKVAWVIIRDMTNIAFIFAIAYIAIATILRITGKGIKSLLTNLIIAALLVNFSFFFTGVIIDASNITTLQLYNQVLDAGKESKANSAFGDTELTPEQEEEDIRREIQRKCRRKTRDDLAECQRLARAEIVSGKIDIVNVGISGVFMQELKMASLYESDNLELDETNLLLVGFLGTIIILILTFVFLVIAMLLITRLVVFVFLLILSPIAYMGWAFPAFKKYSSDWWSAMWGQALFAPLYMLLTLVIIKVISNQAFRDGIYEDASGGVGANTGFSALGSGQLADAIPVLINYIIVMGLIIGSVILAKKTADSSGSGFSKISAAISQKAGGFSGAIGRGTVGRLGAFAYNNQQLRAAARGEKGRVAKIFAGGAIRASAAAQGASFDVRNAPLGGASAFEMAGAGKAVGKGKGAGGFKDRQEAYTKKAIDRAEVVGSVYDKGQEAAKKTAMEDYAQNVAMEEKYTGGAPGELFRGENGWRKFRALGNKTFAFMNTKRRIAREGVLKSINKSKEMKAVEALLKGAGGGGGSTGGGGGDTGGGGGTP